MPPLPHSQETAIREALDERASILEFDAGLPQSVADTHESNALRVYRYRVTDHHEVWLILIAPGCTLDDARHTLSGRFGAERLLDVMPCRQTPARLLALAEMQRHRQTA
ncbi:hypothetical protein [Thiocystis violascens]|nr:hypothetical protein [Thiocystis violascens]